MSEKFIWEAPEYVHTEKNSDWYWAVGIISISIIIASILYHNFLFAGVIALSVFLLVYFAGRAPRVIPFEVSEKGVKINTLLYPFDSLESFWIENENLPDPKIILKSKKIFVPYVLIPLPEESSEKLRAFLRVYLPEVEHHEPLSHKIMEYLGF